MLSIVRLLKNWLNTNLKLKLPINNLRHTELRFKNWWPKIINSAMKSETLRKISDFQLHKSESWIMSWKFHVTKLKLFKEEFKNLVMSIKLLLNMRTKLLSSLKKLRDWTVLLKRKMPKSDNWMNKQPRWMVCQDK